MAHDATTPLEWARLVACHLGLTQTHPRADRRFFEKVNLLKKFRVFLNSLQTASWGVSRAHGPCYMALAAATWFPMGVRVPTLTPNHPKAVGRLSKKHTNLDNFHSTA